MNWEFVGLVNLFGQWGDFLLRKFLCGLAKACTDLIQLEELVVEGLRRCEGSNRASEEKTGRSLQKV
jgi:hypothetical protein